MKDTMMKHNQTSTYWQCGRFRIGLDTPKIMGIVNVTPDSFSDGGVYGLSEKTAVEHARKLVDEGADILDVGGESSRPGAEYVSEEAEWARVAPVLEAVASLGKPVTLDTRRTGVMRKALASGWVDGINDIEALTALGALELLAGNADVGICLMHMQGQPESMQNKPQYTDVVGEVAAFLQERVWVCTDAGISKQRITVDPGFGFGKTLAHNIALMRRFDEWLQAAGCPALIGVSRKHMIGEITGEQAASARVSGSVTAAVAAVARGASVVRVHDVAATRQGLQVWAALGETLV